MKAKYSIIVQVIVLAGTVAAGFVLKGDLTNGPRLAHQGLGTLSGIAGIASVILLMREKALTLIKSLSWVALVFTLIAGLAGKSLQMTTNYDLSFTLMRVSGALALIAAASVLYLMRKPAVYA